MGKDELIAHSGGERGVVKTNTRPVGNMSVVLHEVNKTYHALNRI